MDSWQATDRLTTALSARLAKVAHDLSEAMRPLAEAAAALPVDLDELWRYLADRGWYISLDMPVPFIRQLAKLLRASRGNDIERHMIKWATERADGIEHRLCRLFTKRSRILKAAFGAYREGLYELSIPVMLSQADGMCYDIIGTNLFSRNPKCEAIKRKLIKKLPKFMGEPVLLWGLFDLFAQAFLQGTSVMVDTGTRRRRRAGDPDFGPLSRHEILHGNDMDYATRPNALRAVLMLDYLHGVARILKDHQEHVADVSSLIKEHV